MIAAARQTPGNCSARLNRAIDQVSLPLVSPWPCSTICVGRVENASPYQSPSGGGSDPWKGAHQMSNVTKKDFIDRIVLETGVKRPIVRLVVTRLLDAIVVKLAEGSRIELRDFGVFEVKHRAPRLAQNPKTLAKVRVPAKSSVKFKAGRKMKEQVAGKDGPSGGSGGSSDGRGPRTDPRGGGGGDDGREPPVVQTTATRVAARA